MDIDPPPPGRQLCSSALASLAGRNDGVTVDWTWDSLQLGDGGEYGEEWGSMHDRFQRGLKRLLRYYERESDPSMHPTVVILVTHGAGCNAILGALTRKPVLTDIPISSLSMAVLRPQTPSPAISLEYELLLQADTSHLITSSPQSKASTFTPSTSSSDSRTREVLRQPDNRVIEYHHFRSRSISSGVPAYHPPPTTLSHHPSLKLRTTSATLISGRGSPRLWTPTTPKSETASESEEELNRGATDRRKRAVGLWRSWAGEQNVNGNGTADGDLARGRSGRSASGSGL